MTFRHQERPFRRDATVLADYALTTKKTNYQRRSILQVNVSANISHCRCHECTPNLGFVNPTSANPVAKFTTNSLTSTDWTHVLNTCKKNFTTVNNLVWGSVNCSKWLTSLCAPLFKQTVYINSTSSFLKNSPKLYNLCPCSHNFLLSAKNIQLLTITIS